MKYLANSTFVILMFVVRNVSIREHKIKTNDERCLEKAYQ